MKLSHDLKNINIHLVNFYFIYLMIFINDPQQSCISIEHGPHYRCPKIGICVPCIILRWAIRLGFLVL